MSLLPNEIYYEIITFMTFKSRSKICSVSKLFEKYAIKVSKSKSIPEYYTNGFQYTDGSWEKIVHIYNKYDYHLIVRLKQKNLIDIYLACASGNKDLINLVIDKHNIDYQLGFAGACRAGHYNIAELMIKKGANDWNECLREACMYGRPIIVQLAISKGANDWNEGLYSACEGLHYTVGKCKTHGINDNDPYYDKFAKYNDFLQVMRIMIGNGATECRYCGEPVHGHYNKYCE